jgi:ABC-2 type transport system permease protein
VLTSLVANMVSMVVVVLVALIMGFRADAGPLDWFGAIAILAVYTLALTWLAIIPGLTAKTPDGVSGVSYPLIFLPFVSSAFVPTSSMSAPVRWFAEHQPVTPVVNTVRDLWSGRTVGSEWWTSLIWCGALLAIAYVLALRAYRRKVA